MSQSSFARKVKDKFDQRTTYDKGNTHHPRVAARLIAQSNLQRGWRVLDVACGTGLVTFPAAETVGSEGSVIGLDISSGMLQQVFSLEQLLVGAAKLQLSRKDLKRPFYSKRRICLPSLAFLINVVTPLSHTLICCTQHNGVAA